MNATVVGSAPAAAPAEPTTWVAGAPKKTPVKAPTVVGTAAAAPSAAIRFVQGPNAATFEGDAVFLKGEGSVTGSAGLKHLPFQRGYLNAKQGELRTAHGSPAPASAFTAPGSLASTPGAAFDAAARALGIHSTRFAQMAESKPFYVPQIDKDLAGYAGSCHGWSYATLVDAINELVDVPGPDGQRGVWLGGQWLSRADLGSFAIAVTQDIAINEGKELFKTRAEEVVGKGLSATDLLYTAHRYLMNGGGGVIMDVDNDEVIGRRSVFNHPITGATVESSALGPEFKASRAAILKLAHAEGYPLGTDVKLVRLKAEYVVETAAGNENDPVPARRDWNMYAVTDASGKVLTSYLATDARVRELNLPEKNSEALPDYVWKPNHATIKDYFAGVRGRALYRVEASPQRNEFLFFMDYLRKAVSGETRARFEADVAKKVDPKVLAEKYPTVANAYSPEQWNKHFAPLGLNAAAFGASFTSAFEADVKKLSGIIDDSTLKRLVARYPQIGAAYTEQQWQTQFQGLDPKAFGANWAAFREEAAGRTPFTPKEAAKLAAKYPDVARAFSKATWESEFGARGLDAKAFGAP